MASGALGTGAKAPFLLEYTRRIALCPQNYVMVGMLSRRTIAGQHPLKCDRNCVKLQKVAAEGSIGGLNGKTSSAVKDRYNAKAYDSLTVRMPKGSKARVAQAGAQAGTTMNGVLNQAVRLFLEKGSL